MADPTAKQWEPKSVCVPGVTDPEFDFSVWNDVSDDLIVFDFSAVEPSIPALPDGIVLVGSSKRRSSIPKNVSIYDATFSLGFIRRVAEANLAEPEYKKALSEYIALSKDKSNAKDKGVLDKLAMLSEKINVYTSKHFHHYRLSYDSWKLCAVKVVIERYAIFLLGSEPISTV